MRAPFRNVFAVVREYRRLVLWLLAALVGALIPVGWQSVKGYRYRRAFRAAEEALARRDYAAVRDRVQSCLDVRPDSFEAHFLAARSARLAEDYPEAERHLDACRELRGVTPEMALEFALSAAQSGRLAEYEGALWDRVETGHPEAAEILEALARGYVRDYLLGPALHALNGWLERVPDSRAALKQRAWVNERLHRTAGAIDDYRRAVELNPEDDDARLSLAGLLADTNRAREALPHFEQLETHKPDDPEVLLGLAGCRLQLGQAPEARQALDQLDALGNVASADRPLVLNLRGKLGLLEGRPQEAEGWFRRAVAASPDDFGANDDLARCLQQLGKQAEAKKYREQCARLEKEQQRLDQVTRRITEEPKNPEPRYEAGMILLRQGREHEGVSFLETALQQDPNYRPAHVALAGYYERLGRLDRARYHRQFLQ